MDQREQRCAGHSLFTVDKGGRIVRGWGDRSTDLAIFSNSVDTGEWVDYRLTKMSTEAISELANHLYQLLSIALINFAWRQQYVYIACFPMGRDVCKCFFFFFTSPSISRPRVHECAARGSLNENWLVENTEVDAHNNDANMKHYVESRGLGCYFPIV